jgi:nicotinate-nucleotide adenylyltransferase
LDSRPTTDDRRLAVGILGGTFDPIHYGHLRPAQEACTQLELAELRFVPAFRSPLRASPVAAREHRLRMVELAIHGLAGFRLDDRELRRGGVSYTVTTLEELRGELGDRALCLIIGMDQFRSFEHWHRWREILDLGHLVVLNRPGCEPPSPPDWAAARLTADGAALARTAAGRLVFLTVQPQDISATRIRERLARGESVAGLVPPAVIEYIQSNRLYGR